jgi:hypothetical protein
MILKLLLTFGGMCMLPQHRGGACFCTRGAMQGYDVGLFIVALAKTVTPAGGPRREPGRAVAPATKLSLKLLNCRTTERQLHIPACCVLWLFKA